MFLYPALHRAEVFDLNTRQMGIYTGATLHEVAHVYGAGEAMDAAAVTPEPTIETNTQQNEALKSCGFCENHEDGDTLYDSADWDGGIGYDFIRDIKYCPLCGRKLRV